MLIINDVRLPLDTDFSDLKPVVSKILKIDIQNIKSARLYKKSVDARKKADVHFCVSLVAKIVGNEEKIIKVLKNVKPFSEEKYVYKTAERLPEQRPVVVGFGPCGMFAALTLAKAGLKPVVIERGYDVDTRTFDIERYFSGGRLNENSNVQFGEGGAGTFSDGKLNTGIKDVRCREILKQFVNFGAKGDILTDAKPHIGTDILKNVVKNIREYIISLGGEVRFASKLDGIFSQNGNLEAISVNGEKIPCEYLLLCIGHSARDTFKMLYESNIAMSKKAFAMGVRIEHLQSDINKSLYGDFASHKALGAADYKLATHLENGRGVYTFCMCPGGEVINASSEAEGIAVNGMSLNARGGENANSAVLVGITPDDFSNGDVLEGCRLQRSIEQAAYKKGGGKVPVITLGRFVFGDNTAISRIKPTVKPFCEVGDLDGVFPNYIESALKEGLLKFGKSISGFDCRDAVISAAETRSSSPVRIERDENGVSVSLKGLYPCGEGAGYAGGIMSAAADGMKTAERVIEAINSRTTADLR